MNIETTRTLRAIKGILRNRGERYARSENFPKAEAMQEAIDLIDAYNEGVADEYRNSVEREKAEEGEQ